MSRRFLEGASCKAHNHIYMSKVYADKDLQAEPDLTCPHQDMNKTYI